MALVIPAVALPTCVLPLFGNPAGKLALARTGGKPALSAAVKTAPAAAR
ncbi:MAG: hypothetical protein KGL44_05840 [Sphingomonadales bacterium]|nr:hypothetical protein [Sphingomonadales bacterium]